MKTILIVDDEYGIADGVAELLGDEGYRTFTAANGQQAIERIGEIRPDLILIDLMMPIMDGAQTIGRLKANPATAGIPVILMSALAESASRQRTDGYDLFLRKPFSADALFGAVERFLKED